MVINPNDLFENISVYTEVDNSYLLIKFPAINLSEEEETDHEIHEFAYEEIERFDKEYGEGIVEFKSFANVEFTDPETDICTIHGSHTTNEGEHINYNATYEIGLYCFAVNVNRMNELGLSDEEGRELVTRIINVICMLVIMSVQIAAVLSKENIDPDFYDNYLTVDYAEDDSIIGCLEEAFSGEITDVYAEVDDIEELENRAFEYIDISERIQLMYDENGGWTWLMSYFPLYLANYNGDILSQEYLQEQYKIYTEEHNKSKVGNRRTVIDLVNNIVKDEEGM